MLEREIKYVEVNIKKQAETSKTTGVRYSIRTKGGKFLVVEDKRKIITQDDGTKTMLCSIKNVTQKYLQDNAIVD